MGSFWYYALCFLVFLIGYNINVLYITVFYHRGLTHGAVRLTPATRRFVAATGNWMTGLDPKGWSCMHRLHHLHSDTPEDPHSPWHLGIFGLALGQLRSYEKTLVSLSRRVEPYTSLVQDLDFEVSWLNRKKLWYLPYVMHFSVFLVTGLATGYWMLGYAYFVGIMSHPIQGWMVNSLGHRFGYRNFATDDRSRNNAPVAWFVAGEGYQNNHHHSPSSARFSAKRGEWDWGYAWCLVAEKLGWLEIVNHGEEKLPARHPGLVTQPA